MGYGYYTTGTGTGPGRKWFDVGDIDACAATCTARPTCVGFNWHVSFENTALMQIRPMGRRNLAAAAPCELATGFDTAQPWTATLSWETFQKIVPADGDPGTAVRGDHLYAWRDGKVLGSAKTAAV